MRIERIDCGLAVTGEFDAAAVEPFDVALREAMLESGGAFMLDLGGLTFMDSSGVNALLRTRALLGREERDLVLVCPAGPPRRAIDLIGVADLFTIFTTIGDAQAALVRPR